MRNQSCQSIGNDLRNHATEYLTKKFHDGQFGIVRPEDLEYYSFPQSFGSTAGPFGGIGGQAITSFQIEVFTHQYGGYGAVIFCGGRFWKWIEKFTPNMQIENKFKQPIEEDDELPW